MVTKILRALTLINAGRGVALTLLFSPGIGLLEFCCMVFYCIYGFVFLFSLFFLCSVVFSLVSCPLIVKSPYSLFNISLFCKKKKMIKLHT